jgi:hypothetical protein
MPVFILAADSSLAVPDFKRGEGASFSEEKEAKRLLISAALPCASACLAACVDVRQ